MPLSLTQQVFQIRSLCRLAALVSLPVSGYSRQGSYNQSLEQFAVDVIIHTRLLALSYVKLVNKATRQFKAHIYRYTIEDHFVCVLSLAH